MWTIDREVDQPIRHRNFNASGGSYLADMTLRLSPDLDISGVVFSNELKEPEATPYVMYVERGIQSVIQRRPAEGRSVGHLRVALTAMPIQLVDAKGYRFAEAAERAIEMAFGAAEVEI